MAVTLEQARLTEQDHFVANIIDEFRKSSILLDKMEFDQAASPTGGGSSWGYMYDRVKTQATATTRVVNTEFATQEAEVDQHSVILKILGGAFNIDRAIAKGGGIVDRTAFQFRQKIKASQALFSDMVINGDSAVDSAAFDGLEVALAGSSTEWSNGTIDLSDSAKVTANFTAFLDELDEFLGIIDGTPTILAGNSKMCAKLRAVARRSDMYQTTKDDFGRQVEHYGVIPFVDLGAKSGSNDPIIKTAADGTSPLYAVRIGLDGFHAVTPAGQPLLTAYEPDFTTPKAVKTGEVEMITAAVLKATKAAGVMRGIKVA